GYAVRQFFLNGGSEAHVVRIAKNAQAANRTLQNAAPADVLVLTALDEGKSGNAIQIAIDYDTPNPASTFNLVLAYTDPDDPSQRWRRARRRRRTWPGSAPPSSRRCGTSSAGRRSTARARTRRSCWSRRRRASTRACAYSPGRRTTPRRGSSSGPRTAASRRTR